MNTMTFMHMCSTLYCRQVSGGFEIGRSKDLPILHVSELILARH